MSVARDSSLRALEKAFFATSIVLCIFLSVGLEARAIVSGYRPAICVASIALYVLVTFVMLQLAWRVHRSPGWRPWSAKRTVKFVNAPDGLRSAVHQRLDKLGIVAPVTVRLIPGVPKADAFVIRGTTEYEVCVTAGLWTWRIYQPLDFDAVIDHEAGHILAKDPSRYVFLRSLLAATGFWVLARIVVIVSAPGFLSAAGYARMLPMPTLIGAPDIARITEVGGNSIVLPAPQYLVSYGSTPILSNVIFFLALVHVLAGIAIALCYVGFIRMKEHVADLVAQRARDQVASSSSFCLDRVLGAERPSFWHPHRSLRIAVATGTRSAVPYALVGALLGLGGATLRIVLGSSSAPAALNLPGGVAQLAGFAVLIGAGTFVVFALNGAAASRAKAITVLSGVAVLTSTVVLASYLLPWLSFDLLGEQTTGIAEFRRVEVLDAILMYESAPLWVLLCCVFHVFLIREEKVIAARKFVGLLVFFLIAGLGFGYMRYARGMYTKSRGDKLLASLDAPPADPIPLSTDPMSKRAVDFVDYPSRFGNTRYVLLLTTCRFLEIASDPPLFFAFDDPSFVMWLPPRGRGLEGELNDVESFFDDHSTRSSQEQCARYLHDAGYR